MLIPGAPAVDFGNIHNLLTTPHSVFSFSFIFIVSNHVFTLIFISRWNCSAIASIPTTIFQTSNSSVRSTFFLLLCEDHRQFCFVLWPLWIIKFAVYLILLSGSLCLCHFYKAYRTPHGIANAASFINPLCRSWNNFICDIIVTSLNQW